MRQCGVEIRDLLTSIKATSFLSQGPDTDYSTTNVQNSEHLSVRIIVVSANNDLYLML